MPEPDVPPALTDPLEEWHVTLHDGATLRVWAHGYSEQNGVVRFTALARGTPHFEVTIAELPARIVRSVFSA